MRRYAFEAPKLRWWQIRTEDFALLLYILIIPRILVLGLYTLMTMLPEDPSEKVFISDVAGWDLTYYFDILGLLTSAFILTCATTALLERVYGRIKWSIIFIGIAGLLWLADRVTNQAFAGFFIEIHAYWDSQFFRTGHAIQCLQVEPRSRSSCNGGSRLLR